MGSVSVCAHACVRAYMCVCVCARACMHVAWGCTCMHAYKKCQIQCQVPVMPLFSKNMKTHTCMHTCPHTLTHSHPSTHRHMTHTSTYMHTHTLLPCILTSPKNTAMQSDNRLHGPHMSVISTHSTFNTCIKLKAKTLQWMSFHECCSCFNTPRSNGCCFNTMDPFSQTTQI